MVVPFFGSSQTIENCVRSVLSLVEEGASPSASLELLLVDNASTDDSRERIAPFESDPRVRVLREEEPGAYAARNAALRAARGRRIAFTDADCEVASGAGAASSSLSGLALLWATTTPSTGGPASTGPA